MGIELRPLSQVEMSVREVTDRLSREFSVVEVDIEQGRKHALERAAFIERAPARLFLGHHEQALQFATRLRQLAVGEAAVVRFGDSPEAPILTLVVIPGDPLKLGFRSHEEEVELVPLIKRCARALDCETVEF